MADKAEYKGLGLIEIKDEDRGEIEAVVATLGVIDRDGDIIRPGAIKSGTKVKVSAYRHEAMYGARPVGAGTIAVEDNRAVFRGRLFLKTAEARETFEVLKELGADQEWSFGYIIKGHEVPDEAERKQGAYRILTKLEPIEVSPVLMGAGLGTGTRSVKEANLEREEARAAEEAARLEAEQAAADATQRAAEAEALAAQTRETEAKAAEVNRAKAVEEFDRFQHTMRRFVRS